MKIIYGLIITGVVAGTLAMPVSVLGQGGGNQNQINGNGGLQPIVTCDGPFQGNRQCTINAFIETLKRVVNVVITIAFSFMAIVISWAGFLYLTAGGDMSKIKEAHRVLKMAVIGFIIVLLAWVLVRVFYDIIGINKEEKPNFDLLGRFEGS